MTSGESSPEHRDIQAGYQPVEPIEFPTLEAKQAYLEYLRTSTGDKSMEEIFITNPELAIAMRAQQLNPRIRYTQHGNVTIMNFTENESPNET